MIASQDIKTKDSKHVKTGRTNRLEIRLTPKERVQLEKRATKANQTLSAYCRDAILRNKGEPVIEVDVSQMPDVLRQLKGAATNLNQLARAVNAYGLSIDSVPALSQTALEVKRASLLVTEMLAASHK